MMLKFIIFYWKVFGFYVIISRREKNVFGNILKLPMNKMCKVFFDVTDLYGWVNLQKRGIFL